MDISASPIRLVLSPYLHSRFRAPFSFDIYFAPEAGVTADEVLHAPFRPDSCCSSSGHLASFSSPLISFAILYQFGVPIYIPSSSRS